MKGFKVLVASLVVMAFMVLVVGSAFAESMGYIDVAKVFKGYKETEKAEEQIKKEKDVYEKEFKEAQEKLAKAEKDNKSKEEIEKMKKEFEENLEPKRTSLLALNEQLTGKLQQDIVASVKKVAKKVGIDVVVDKQAIITGGVDLTEMVVNDLNKK